MIFNDIAEYEDSDSKLAKGTIFKLNNELDNLKEDNANMKYTIKQLLIANKEVCDRNKKAREYIIDFLCTEDYISLDGNAIAKFTVRLEKILKGDDIDE